MPRKKSATEVSKNSVKKREKAEAEADAAALAASKASPPGASQAPESKPELAGSHTSPSSAAAKTSAAAGEETTDKNDSLVTTKAQSLLVQSASTDAGSTLPPPGAEGITIDGQQSSSEHKDSLSGTSTPYSTRITLKDKTTHGLLLCHEG